MEPAVTMMMMNGEEWNSITNNGGGCDTTEEADFMSQFFLSCLELPSEVDGGFGLMQEVAPTGSWIGHESYMMAAAGGVGSFSESNNNSEFPQSSKATISNSTSNSFSSAANHYTSILPENYCLSDDPNNDQFLAADDSNTMPIDQFFTLINASGDQAFPAEDRDARRMEEQGGSFMNEAGLSIGYMEEPVEEPAELAYLTADRKQQNLQQVKSDANMSEDQDMSVELDRNTGSSNNSRKRPQNSSHDHDVEKGNKPTKSRKNQKIGSCNENKQEEEDNHAPLIRHGSDSCSSEDDDANRCHDNGGATFTSSSSQENTARQLNSILDISTTTTKRASRGSATDPQSLYARKRRERINERLRILQNLVPNGTKVDISTMLEEAVQYVKFLQLQIKMLSSDDLWMYSPIAYNGFDMKLNALTDN